MKVIFLDMDGVLNNAYHLNNRYIEKDKFEQLQRIVKETGAKVVLSTSWREFPDWSNFLHDFFCVAGIDVVGSTPVRDGWRRQDEIREWFKDNDFPIDAFVVLDDIDMSSDFPENMVCTCEAGRIGLDTAFADRAISILNGRSREEEVVRLKNEIERMRSLSEQLSHIVHFDVANEIGHPDDLMVMEKWLKAMGFEFK